MSRVDVYSNTITSCNILHVEAGTNCPKGGDSGHGGRTVLRLIDYGCTDMRVSYYGDEDGEGVEIVFGGDTEHSTLIQGLEFALKVLKGQTKGMTAYHTETVRDSIADRDDY